jgi:serpin B
MSRMNRWLFLGLWLSLSLGCSQVPEPPGKSLQSKLERITTAPPAAVLSATVEGNTSAALALYGRLLEGDENLFFSPHSIISVLGLTFGGADGTTKSELETVLHAPAAPDFHRSMNHLDRELASRGRSSSGANGEPFALTILNQLFVDSALKLEPGYLDLLAQEYGADARQLDLAARPADATRLINEWVSTATKQHIPSLLDSGDLTGDSRMVLLNAMYFSSAWSTNFEESRTEPLPFHGLPGDVQVQMMRSSNLTARELETPELQAVELDYSGGELSMVIIMPKADYRAWEATLGLGAVTGVRDGLAGALLDLSMPKFETRSRRDLRPPLEARGLKAVFDPAQADLSAMSADPVYLDFLRHEAWIDVSESGTRAAAATGGGVSLAPSAPPQPKRVIIDRPFFYFIQDKATKAVLFVGRYVR